MAQQGAYSSLGEKWRKTRVGKVVERIKKKKKSGTSLAIHWLRHHTSTAGGTGAISGLGIKTPHATWLS